MTPATYGRGGVGAQIAYTTARTPLGRLLVGATEHGICFVSLGDDIAALEGALTAEFPAAEIRRDDAVLGAWVGAIVRYLGGEQQGLDLPLDVCATAFQRRVWEALRAIPYGETRSYSQIAAAIGQPTAARAVARACATNPAALVVPCHRVIGEGGSLRGYRWGVERKRELLEREAEGRT
jgi:AraC family transcriptional regulator, regulatory protein of adaptative response / methylated-DNA-[protein]-cysteine methyltransferase